MEVRPAIPSDALSITEIDVESWKYAYRGLIADSILDSRTVEKRMKYWASTIKSGKPYLLVAEKNSIVVGWAAFGPSRDEDAAPQTGEIEAKFIYIQIIGGRGSAKPFFQQQCMLYRVGSSLVLLYGFFQATFKQQAFTVLKD